MTVTTRQIRLAHTPAGVPVTEDFEMVETALPALQPGEVLVAPSYLSQII